MSVKQVIVMRKDLGMRKGKMIAQGAHASLKTLLSLFNKSVTDNGTWTYKCSFKNNSALSEWLNGTFTKICVYVNSEKELMEIYKKAREAFLPCEYIEDCGLTEFHNIPTKTCLCIGPFTSEEIDKITGKLPLL